MNFWLLHISDLHLHGPSDPAANAAHAIAAAVAAHANESSGPRPDTIVVAITGDVTFSGSDPEFLVAEALLQDLKTRLKASFLSVHIAVCPGNHDCVLVPSSSTRTALLRGYDDAIFDRDYFDSVASVQANFWKFASRVSGAPSTPDYHYDVVVPIGERSVRIKCLNTAWCSVVPEDEATLLLPRPMAEEAFSKDLPSDLVVTLLHHPYRWVTQDHFRDFRDVIESGSDLFLTGHEHVPDRELARRRGRHAILHVEGGVLQEHGQKTLLGSCFNLVEVDLESEQYSYFSKKFDGTIYRTESRSTKEQLAGLRKRSRAAFQLEASALSWSDDIGDLFQHPRQPVLRLNHVFVMPELSRRVIGKDRPGTAEYVPDLVSEIEENKRVAIIGGELSGKTSILKHVFRRFNDAGVLPVYIDASTIDLKDIRGSIRSAIRAQYGESSDLSAFFNLSVQSGVILIDDIGRVPSIRQNDILGRAEELFSLVVATMNSTVELSPTTGTGETPFLWGYHQIEVMDLTHQKRGELIEKWVRLGTTIDDNEIEWSRAIAYRDAILARVVRTNLLPSVPYFVLLALQQLETHAGQLETDSSYGYLYEAVLTTAIEKSRPKLNVSTVYAYFTGFAGHLFSRLTGPISQDADLLIAEKDFAKWHDEFQSGLGISISRGDAVDDLVRARIFRRREGFIGFRYRNSYFYALARWMKARPSEDLKAHVTDLIAQLHLDESYVTLMFLSHLDSRNVVLDGLLEAASGLLGDVPEECILVSGRHLMDGLAELPRLALPEGSFAEKRKALLAEADERDRVATSAERGSVESAETNEEVLATIREINAATRVVHALGQVLRTHAGSAELSAERKRLVIETCGRLGLKLIGRYFQILRDHADEFRGAILYSLMRRLSDRRGVDEAEVREMVAVAFRGLAMELGVNVIRSVSDAVGSRILRPSLDVVVNNASDTFSWSAVRLSASLDMDDRLPLEAIEDSMASAEKSLFGRWVIGRLVWGALRRYVFSPLELEKGCSAADIETDRMKLVKPRTKVSRSAAKRKS